MPASPHSPDPLQRVLTDVELELRQRLQEACVAESESLSTKSSAEIRELEDNLLAAAVAAGQALALRKEISKQGTERPEVPEASPPDVEVPAGAKVTGVREFQDEKGRAWRAWLVTPRATRAARVGDQLLGQYNEGWICFETLDSSARRRLPCQRSLWADLRDEELETLLDQAISVPERKARSG